MSTRKRCHRKCIVPSCGYRQYSLNFMDPKTRRTLFSFPKDEVKARAWAAQIPGLRYENMKKSTYICDIHFELPDALRKSYYEDSTLLKTTRINFDKSSMIPTLHLGDNDVPVSLYSESLEQEQSTEVFFENNMHLEYYPAVPYSDAENSYQSSLEQDSDASFLSSSVRNINTHIEIVDALSLTPDSSAKPIELKTTLLDALGDLSASEQALVNIKKEMYNCPDEELGFKIEDEWAKNLEEPTVYEELKSNVNYYASYFPKNWTMLIENDVLLLSKKCYVQENGLSVMKSEKSITLTKEGKVSFSVAGQNLDFHSVFSTSVMKNIENLLQMVAKFDVAKICQGIRSNELHAVSCNEEIYKDHLGFLRHNYCPIISDHEQCDLCIV